MGAHIETKAEIIDNQALRLTRTETEIFVSKDRAVYEKNRRGWSEAIIAGGEGFAAWFLWGLGGYPDRILLSPDSPPDLRAMAATAILGCTSLILDATRRTRSNAARIGADVKIIEASNTIQT